MKKNLMKYMNDYAVIMMSFFILNNMILRNLEIRGILYQIIMVILILLNLIIMIIFRKKINHKSLVIIVYFFIWIFSKNIYYCMFAISSMLILMITRFFENNFIKIITLCIVLFVVVFYIPIVFNFLLIFGTDLNKKQGEAYIYEDTHYYCKNHYEIYSYSAGAMDRYHFSIGKYYKILNIDGIIYISYSNGNEVSQKEYEYFLNNYNCILAGEENGFK